MKYSEYSNKLCILLFFKLWFILLTRYAEILNVEECVCTQDLALFLITEINLVSII